MTDTLTTTSSPAPARRRPPRTALALTAGAAAIALGVGGFLATTAAFTDTETVTGNSVKTATLDIGNPVSAPVTVTDLLPEQTAPTQQVLSFANTGTVAFDYTVSLANVQADTPKLLEWVPVTLTIDGGTPQTGTLASPPTIPAQELAVGATQKVSVTVGLSGDADNDVQKKGATFDVVVNATQK